MTCSGSFLLRTDSWGSYESEGPGGVSRAAVLTAVGRVLEEHRTALRGGFTTAAELDHLVAMVESRIRPRTRFSERAAEIRRLRPTVGMDILVYTPAELRRVQQRPFVRLELLEKGKVVPLRPLDEAMEWLAFSEEDLRMARLALGEGIDNQVCFHAQQCVEKCLKALLARQGALVPRTRRIVDLWQLLPDAIRTQFADLQDALPGPRAESPPDRAQAERALEAAEAAWQVAHRLIASGGG